MPPLAHTTTGQRRSPSDNIVENIGHFYNFIDDSPEEEIGITIKKKCSICAKRVSGFGGHKVNKKELCGACFFKEYNYCNHCNKPEKVISLHHELKSVKCSVCFVKVKNKKKKKTETVYQSDENSIVVKNRSFGIELETLVPVKNANKINDHLPSKTRVHTDNSIHPKEVNNLGIEYVSPILKGVSGLKYVSNLVNLLKKNGAYTDESCAYHLHLGMDDIFIPSIGSLEVVFSAENINDLSNKLEKLSKNVHYDLSNYRVIAIPVAECDSLDKNDKKMLENYSDFENIVYGNNEKSSSFFCFTSDRLGKFHVDFFATGSTTKLEKMNFIILPKKGETTSILLWLNNLYASFDPVFRSFFDESRRDNNFSIANKYIPESVVPVSDNIGIHSVYGVPVPSSRYLGLNINAIHKHGTVELRYHSGTIDKASIINWITLNQHIFDFVIKTAQKGNIDVLRDLCYEADFFVTPRFKFEVLLKRLNDLPESVSQYYLNFLGGAEEEDEKCLKRLKENKSDSSLYWSHQVRNRRRSRE